MHYSNDLSSPLTALSGMFGYQLENLTTSEKLHLLGTLAIQQQVIADGDEDSDDYRVSDAYQEHPFKDETGKVIAACRLLHGSSDSALRGLMLAIANQIYN